MDTLLLDIVAWDLVVDLKGNIALASDPYSLAQDAASAIRLFQGELWYDTTQGLPYWTEILGRTPNVQLLKQLFANAALSVPEVVASRVFISGITGRRLTGQVQVSTSTDLTAVASF